MPLRHPGLVVLPLRGLVSRARAAGDPDPPSVRRMSTVNGSAADRIARRPGVV